MKYYLIISIFKSWNIARKNSLNIFLILVLSFPSMTLKSQHESDHFSLLSRFSKNISNFNNYVISDSVIKHKHNTGMTSRDIDFYFIIGLSFDKDYSNYISKAFESNGRELSGFTGWLNLGAGLEFKIANNLYLSPSISCRFSRIGITDAFTNATSTRYINGLYSIGLGGAYYIPVGKTALYINAKLLSNLSGSDSDLEKYGFKYETKEIGFESNAGWRLSSGLANSISFEIGYSIIPVSIQPIYSSFYQYYNERDDDSKKSFGRIFFTIRGNVGLWNY